MEIYNAKPEVFVDEELSRPIKVYKEISSVMKPKRKFIGTAQIMVPNYGPMESPFEIEATTIEEAFEKHDEAYEAEVKRIEAEIEKQIQEQKHQIVSPKKDIII